MKFAAVASLFALFAAPLAAGSAWSATVGPAARDRAGASAERAGAAPAEQAGGKSARWHHDGAPEQPKVLGRTYGEWAARNDAWVWAGPIGQNVVQDTSGEFCAANQPDGPVWFLAGTFGGPAVRHCTVPRGRALFYGLLSVTWLDCPGTTDDTVPDSEVRDVLASILAGPVDVTSTINGVSVTSLQLPIVRAQSPAFTSVLPDNNLWSPVCPFPVPAGRSGRLITDGYWVMAPPLPPGQHTLTLRGAHQASGFETSVTYHLTVR